MSHGGDFSAKQRQLDGRPDLPPLTPIRRALPVEDLAEESPPVYFAGEEAEISSWPPEAREVAAGSRAAKAPAEVDFAPAAALDPWGAQEQEDEFELEPEPDLPVRRRGGGTLTIPLLCVGIAILACVTLLPMADELHQLSWEREKLKADVAHLKEQVRVNDEFLQRVADDPTLAERLAQRQMKYIREGSQALPVRAGGRDEISPFQLVNVPPPPPMQPYRPLGGALATLVRQPRAQLYLSGLALLLMATGLVLGYVPKDRQNRP